MMAARVKIFAALVLAAGACHGQLNIRYLTATTAVFQAEVPSSVPLRWYQGESLIFDHVSTSGGTNADWSTLPRLTAVWSVVADQLDDPQNTNVYLWSTGAVSSAVGRVTFTVPPEWTAMPASNYWTFVTLFQSDPSGITNTSVGVVYRSTVRVQYRNTGTAYAGPWQIPSNMIDGVARARADAAYSLALTNAPSSIDAPARTSASNALSGILSLSNRTEAVNDTATNAQANALLASVAAASKYGGEAVTNALVSYLTTNRVPFATEAMTLKGTNANYSWEMVGGLLQVYEVTNTTTIEIVAVNESSAFYPPGQRFVNSATDVWTNTAQGNITISYELPFGYSLKISDVEVASFDLPTRELPRIAIDSPPSGIVIDWIPATNVYTIGIDAYARTAASNAQARAELGITNSAGSTISAFWAGPATNAAITNASTVYFTW
jgi:hypothetical protein